MSSVIVPASPGSAAGEGLRVDREGPILVLTVDNPPVNALSHAVRVGLIDAISGAQRDDAVAALVLRCKGRSFISGADIREFANPRNPRVLEMVEWVETSRKPIVAAVHGAALGGGLELVMACHYRTAHAGASFGLPEVKIGLLPGAGGTQRLPRLIGVERALAVMIDGETLGAEEALASGLVDRITRNDVHADAIAYARELVRQGAGPRRTSERQITPADPALLEQYRARIRMRHPDFLAPLHCIDAVDAAALPFIVGSTREKTLFFELFGSRQARACQHIFFAQRQVGRLPSPEAAVSIGTGIVLVGSGVRADRLAGALPGARPATRRLTEAQWHAQTPEALRSLLADNPWFIDATDAEASARSRMLCTAAGAGATVLSTVATGSDLPGLAQAMPPDAWLSGLSAPLSAGASLVETWSGPRGTAALAPVHQALRRAGATPLFLGAAGESLQSRLLATARSVLQCALEEGVSESVVTAALQAFGFDPATFGLGAPGADTGTAEVRQTVVDQLVAAAVDEARSLVAEGPFTAEQIDVAWTLGLGWPIHRGAPAWRAASAAAPARRS